MLVNLSHLLCLAHCFDAGLELFSCTLTLVKPPVADLGLMKTTFLFPLVNEKIGCLIAGGKGLSRQWIAST